MGRKGVYDGDVEVLRSRDLCRLADSAPAELALFKDAPIIVGLKTLRDLLNARIIEHRATQTKQIVYLYHSRDVISKDPVSDVTQETLWMLPSSSVDDAFGRLPLFPGMKVMVRENLAFTHRVVNGAEGVVRDIVYEEDDERRRYARVVYVHIPGAGQVSGTLDEDVVPIFPETTTFQHEMVEDGRGCKKTVSRTQVPLVPSYAYTDYKSQGRSLTRAIVDLDSAQSLQGVYVMLSRVRSLKGLAILQPFAPKKLTGRLSQELRDELRRLDTINLETSRWFARLEQITSGALPREEQSTGL